MRIILLITLVLTLMPASAECSVNNSYNSTFGYTLLPIKPAKQKKSWKKPRHKKPDFWRDISGSIYVLLALSMSSLATLVFLQIFIYGSGFPLASGMAVIFGLGILAGILALGFLILGLIMISQGY